MAETAIACRDLWMVFGPGAERRLAALRAERPDASPAGLGEALRGEGFVPAVRGVSFEVARGELFVIMGLSGSGKSTVIRCVSRLLEPTAGAVDVLGEDLLKASKRRMTALRRDRIGMVFQHFGLFPHMRVWENVSFPLRVQGIAAAARRERAEAVISLVGLEGKSDSYPRELSGGQRQRVGIARSLVADPDLWFLDEPFSALDPLIRRQLQDEFLSLQSTLHKSIVFITHDMTEALKIADRIAIMRDGVIVQVGTPAQIVLEPVDQYVADFAGDIPRARLMTIGAMMRPAEGAAADGPALSPDMTLEGALALCASRSGLGDMAVRNEAGDVVGMVSAEHLARAAGAAP